MIHNIFTLIKNQIIVFRAVFNAELLNLIATMVVHCLIGVLLYYIIYVS